jgi:hypothetical protein
MRLVLLVTFAAAIVAWVGAVVQDVAILACARWAWRVGFRTFRIERAGLPSAVSERFARGTLTTTRTKIKVVSPRLALFRQRLPFWFPFVTLGIVAVEREHAVFEGRLALFPCVGSLAVLLAVLAAAGAASATWMARSAVVALAAALGIVCTLSIRAERENGVAMAAEAWEVLGHPARREPGVENNPPARRF